MNTFSIEEFEFLLHRLNALHEVEDLAHEGQPELLPAIHKLYRATFKQLRTLIRKILKVSSSMGARGREVSLERLELIFLKLRDQAEIEGARAAKFRGGKARRPKAEAKEIKRMTRIAAKALRKAAKRVGIWNASYSMGHGLNQWL